VIFRKLAVMGGAIAIVGGLGLALPTAAGAASGYPGTTTVTTVPGSTNPGGGTQPCVSTVTIYSGNSAVVVLTGCSPNSTFAISIDGMAAGVTANSDGAGNVTLTIAASDPHLSVNGSTPVPATYGSNTVTLANTSGGAGGTVNVNIPNATTSALGTSGSGSSAGSLAFTGADLLALIIGALFLLAMGTLLVVFTRRRASHQQV
jgi:hypothetical protein